MTLSLSLYSRDIIQHMPPPPFTDYPILSHHTPILSYIIPYYPIIPPSYCHGIDPPYPHGPGQVTWCLRRCATAPWPWNTPASCCAATVTSSPWPCASPCAPRGAWARCGDGGMVGDGGGWWDWGKMVGTLSKNEGLIWKMLEDLAFLTGFLMSGVIQRFQTAGQIQHWCMIGWRAE